MGTVKKCTHLEPSSLLFPFASGNLAEIELSFYVNSGKRDGRPITTYPLDNVSPDLDQSVRYAAEVAYRLALQSSKLGEISYAAGYRLKNMEGETSLTGESAGLAMALALYSELTSIHLGRVVATGALTGLGDGGTVSWVGEVPAKLLGALDGLESGDSMFYPLANVSQVTDVLKKKYVERGIRLIAVGSVEEALNYFPSLSCPSQELVKKSRCVPALAIILLVGMLLVGGYVLGEHDNDLAEGNVIIEESSVDKVRGRIKSFEAYNDQGDKPAPSAQKDNSFGFE
ncbi:S16 family serine protease [Desulfotalea psychrophila]|uniref:Lon proteolytic domain-containing protein n=1 Tax=Desulfotalea psychrophila (strain LSv54 / DSM 12343) TaxID=177439 RepID=Q6ANY0_DESPS|nr:S16 family serine protease [Desulfotalea psychrophila]CAG35944.1 unknown protein [Desulfotalea psychrophila LSv54]